MSNIPKIRFKEFTEDWKQRKLGEIAPLRGGFAFKSDEYASDGIPIIRISNILSDGSVGAEFAHYPEQNNDTAYFLSNGAALLAMSGATTGKVSILHCKDTDKYYQNQRVGFFVPTSECDYGLVSIIVRSQYFMQQLDAVLVAGAQPNVSAKDIDAFEFKIPTSYDEQKMIGEYFKNLDDIIALHQRKSDELSKLKKFMLQKMFPKTNEQFPEIRFKGFTEAWEQRKLSDLVERGSTFGAEKELPRVEYEDIISGTGKLNKDIYTKVSDKAGLKFRAGDVLYGKLRPYLKNWLLPSFSGLAVGDFWVLQPQNIDSRFLYSLIQSDRFDEVANQSTGTKMPRADWNLVSKTEFAIPSSMKEQGLIGQFLLDLDDLITLHQRKLGELQNIKKYMLQNMFA